MHPRGKKISSNRKIEDEACLKSNVHNISLECFSPSLFHSNVCQFDLVSFVRIQFGSFQRSFATFVVKICCPHSLAEHELRTGKPIFKQVIANNKFIVPSRDLFNISTAMRSSFFLLTCDNQNVHVCCFFRALSLFSFSVYI